MEIHLKRATIDDAELIWKMQIESFAELLHKYQDFDTNPGNEPIEEIIAELQQSFSYFYLILADGNIVGAIRIVIMPDGIEKRISPLFVLPEYRNKGIAQQAILEVEGIHGRESWALETVLQEKENCYLYEKMGYRDTGRREIINERITLVLYEKTGVTL